MRFDLGKLVLHIVGVHGADLLAGRSSQNLDDLNQLVDARLSLEKRLAEHELSHDTSSGPDICTDISKTCVFYFILFGARERGHTNLGGIVGGTEYQLRSAVVAGADVGDVGLVGDQNLSAAKVAELENAGAGVQEEVLGLDVTVADAFGMDVGERAEQLVCVQLHLEEWHGSLELVEVTRSTVNGLWDVFKHQVKVDLVLL